MPQCAAFPVLIVLNLLLYLPALNNGFSLDDFNWIERARFAPSWLQFVFGLEPGQIVNAIPRAMILIFVRTFGTHPLPYHLAVFVLHLMTVGLLLVLVERLVGSSRIALFAAVLFSVQTSYDETIFWISAFPHVLAAGLCLVTLVSARSYLENGKKISLILAGLSAIAGLLTKASFFVLLPVVLLLPGPLKRRLHLGSMSAGLIGAGVVLNLSLGGGNSYLIERGYYRVGIHMATNLADYLGWLVLPFDALAERLGDPGILRALRQPLGWIVLVVLILIAVRASAVWRPCVALVFAPLVLVLPLVFDPVSRYTYLPACGLAALGAWWLATERTGSSRSRFLGTSLLIVLAILSMADTRLRDNVWEYREELMATWVSDVVTAYPSPPPSGVITIVGLPTLAIDPGMHLEAALRLTYDDPSVDLEIAPNNTPLTNQYGVLHYDAGRIRTSVPPAEASSNNISRPR